MLRQILLAHFIPLVVIKLIKPLPILIDNTCNLLPRRFPINLQPLILPHAVILYVVLPLLVLVIDP